MMFFCETGNQLLKSHSGALGTASGSLFMAMRPMALV
jgi:hypothetical protein